MARTLEDERSSTDNLRLEANIRQNVIDWNKNQFYRAIGQERWKDAERYKENIEQLEEKPGF